MRHGLAILAFGLGSLSVASPNDAIAQRRTDAKLAASVPLRVVQLEAPPVVTVKRASIGKHILIGSLIGGAATVGAIWYSLEHSKQECICSAMAFVPIVVGGAAVGGIIGAFVYAARSPAKR
jgi:hypothetical protein